MISFFRRSLSSPLVLALLALIAVAFVITGVATDGIGGVPTATGGSVAKVGNTEISETELIRRVELELETQRRTEPSIDMAALVAAGGVERVVDLAMNGRALEIFAERQGMVASKKLVDGAIASIPAFNGPTGSFDRATYLNVLSANKTSESQLRTEFAREALSKALVIPASGAARVPATLVMPYASLAMESRSGVIAAIPGVAFQDTAAPNDAALAAFYKRNITRYTVPERRVVRYAAFDNARFVGKVDATDAEIQKYYDANAAAYVARERRGFTQLIVQQEAQATALLARIRGGMPMADAGKTMKRDALVVPLTDQVAFARLTGPKVAAAAFAARKGEFATIERSGLGFHVVRVDAVETVAATPLSAVRSKIAADLTAQKQRGAMADLLAQIQDAVDDNSTFDEVVKRFGLTAAATPALTAEGRAFEGAPYTPTREVSVFLGEAFKAEPDDDPVVSSLPDNVGHVVWKLDRTIAAAPKPLAELRGQVTADERLDRGSQRAKVAADKIAAAVNAGTPLAVAMRAIGVPLPAPQPVSARRIDIARAQTPVPPPLALMFSMVAKRARVQRIPDGQGWFVVHLDAIRSGDASKVPGLVAATQQQLGQVVGSEYVDQFARAIRLEIGATKSDAAVASLKRKLTGTGPRQ